MKKLLFETSLSKITRPVSAIKSRRLALLTFKSGNFYIIGKDSFTDFVRIIIVQFMVSECK